MLCFFVFLCLDRRFFLNTKKKPIHSICVSQGFSATWLTPAEPRRISWEGFYQIGSKTIQLYFKTLYKRMCTKGNKKPICLSRQRKKRQRQKEGERWETERERRGGSVPWGLSVEVLKWPIEPECYTLQIEVSSDLSTAYSCYTLHHLPPTLQTRWKPSSFTHIMHKHAWRAGEDAKYCTYMSATKLQVILYMLGSEALSFDKPSATAEKHSQGIWFPQMPRPLTENAWKAFTRPTLFLWAC